MLVIGEIHVQRGDLGQARSFFERAIDVFREVRAAYDEAGALTHLGDALATDPVSDAAAAREAWRAALVILDRLSGQLAQTQAERVRARLAEADRRPGAVQAGRSPVNLAFKEELDA